MPWGLAIAAVGSVAGAAISSSSASKAAKTQAKSAQAGMDAATAARDKSLNIGEGYLKPYATLGSEQLPTIQALLGEGPNGAAGMQSLLESYPGFRFAVDEGQKAINNQQIAGGAKYSGNALKAAADYNRNMGAGLFQQYFNNITGIANQGQAAAGGIANLAAGVGSGNAATLQSGNAAIGDANAAGTIGQSNAWTNSIDQITGAASKMPSSSWGNLFSSGGGNAAYNSIANSYVV